MLVKAARRFLDEHLRQREVHASRATGYHDLSVWQMASAWFDRSSRAHASPTFWLQNVVVAPPARAAEAHHHGGRSP
jgi:hypothetical protein